MHMPCAHTPGASKPGEGLLVEEPPGKKIDESAPVDSAPEKAAPSPPSAAPAAKAAPAPAQVPSSAPATATAAMPARAADYALAAPESPLIARISINENVEATVAIMTEVEAAETGATPRVLSETQAEAEAEESKPPSHRSPTDEMSEAEITEAAALDEEFKKEARERKEQYDATTKVSR